VSSWPPMVVTARAWDMGMSYGVDGGRCKCGRRKGGL